MRTPFSPLRARHGEACRAGVRAHSPPIARMRRLLYGHRALKFPVLAVMVASDLGNCRHALAQRVIAGTHEVQLPFGDSNPFFRKLAPELPPSSDPHQPGL